MTQAPSASSASEQAPASCHATEAEAAEFAALLSSTDTDGLSLVVDKVTAQPCLFYGTLWATTSGQCTELGLQALAIALPPINHVETPGAPFSSQCITAQGTGTCAGYANMLCSTSAYPIEGTGNHVLQLLLAAQSSDSATVYQTLNTKSDNP